MAFTSFYSTAQNVTYQTLYTGATFDSRAINQSLPVGSIVGNGNVASGGATYSIAIAVPPGTNGVSPTVSINYHSMVGNGVLGQGWDIGGLSKITRSTRSMYFDNETNPVVMTNSDRFVLDGTRLIAKAGNYGEPNTTYGTESENFATITSKSSQGNGPEWFEVITKDGIKMEYGNSADSRHTGQFATVLTWALSRIQYPDGNYITFKYNTNTSFALLIDEINYTGNAVQGLAPYNQVKFDYKIRTIDENAGFENDTRIESKYLLDKVTTKAEGATVRTYQFNYGHDNINSYLKEVIEAGTNGTQLNATIFKYGDPPAEFSTVGTDGYEYPSSTTITGDFNADGLTDFLEASLIQNPAVYRMMVYVKYPEYMGQSNSFFVDNLTDAPVTYSVVKKQSIPNSFNFLAYDFTGDGADDVLMTNVVGSGQNRTLTSLRIYRTLQNYDWQTNGQWAIQFDPLNISPYSGYSKIHPSGHFIFPGDYDGDGIQDILTMLGSNAVNYNCHLYNGKVQPDFGSIVISGVFALAVSDWPTADKVYIVDFNGDGKSDIMLIKGTSCEVFTFDGWTARRIHYSINILTKDHLSYFGDFNGDRKTDILAKSTTSGAWKVVISGGVNFYESPFTFNTIPDTDPFTGDHLGIADINGDGKSDIYHGWQVSPSPTSNFDVYYGKGYSWNTGASFYRVNSTFTVNLGAPPPMIGDFNGDHRADVINFKNIFNPMDVFYFKKEGRENLLEKLKNGYNHVTEWAYKKLTDENGFHIRGNLTAYPFNAIQPPLYAVSDFKLQNGVGGYNTIQYTYEATKLHRAGKGFLGFGKITANDLATGMKTVAENEFNTTYFTTIPYRTSIYLASTSTLLSQTTNTNVFTSPAAKRFWVQTTNILENKALEGRTTTTVNVYDNFGNVTQSTVNNGVETAVTNTVYGAYPAGILNKPTSVTVSNTRSGQPIHTVSTGFAYNGIGQLTSKTDFNGLAKNVATTYEYFPLGNLKKTTVTPNGPGASAPRNTSSVYDPKGRYAESSINELDQTSSATYDSRWGKPLTSTGIDGLITTYQYDVFGRPTVTAPPAPVAYNITQSYGWDLANGAVWYSLVSHPGKPNVKIWYDLLGREIKKETEGFGNQPITQVQAYDAKGNIISNTQPYKAGETYITTTTQYDQYNRPNNINSGALGTKTISYSYASGELTTTTVTPTGTSSQKTDASGKVTNSTDDGGTLAYTYFSHGGIKDVKNDAVTIAANQYDAYGRQTQLTDANAGTTSYDYNSLGELVSQTNANGATYTLTYDVTGRILSRTKAGEPATTYQYRASGNGINQIEKVTGFAGNLEEYTYDAYGRMLTIKETIDGSPYTTTYTYNNYGDIASVLYPSGFGTNHAYDANGYPTTIKNTNSSVTLYTNTGMNGLGQNTSYTLGNGQTTTINYINGYPTQYLAGTKQNLNLVWDYSKGTLTSRNDAIKAKTESFTYDNLARLKNTTIAANTLTTNYAANGNIVDKSNVGAYSYHQTKFNAVTGVTNPPPSPVPLLQQDITYTPFMQPDKVTEIGTGNVPCELTYTYGADYNRIKSVLKQNGNIINIKYYFSGFDKDITGAATKYVHHIGSPAGLIAIVTGDGSNLSDYKYTYCDHLGSILTVTNNSGTIEAEQSFDAWGRRRNPTTWALLPPTAATGLPYWLYRGYTGHEHLDNFGLINMNGRLYDPVVGRMLSPDNYVQADGSTQSYNRYSYAGNNPLRYTDPDGEVFKLAFFSAVLTTDFISNLLNGVSNPLKTAYRNSNNVINAFSNALQVPIYSKGNTSVTIGIDMLSFGISANFYHTVGNLTSTANVGVGLMSGAMFNWSASYAAGSLNIGIGGGIGASYEMRCINNVETGSWAFSYSAFGASIKYKGYGAGYYQTHYGNVLGPDGKPNNQVVGGVNVFLDDISIRLENDFLAFKDEDRWRSNSVEIGVGNLVIGTRLYNNDPDGEGQKTKMGVTDRMGFSNKGKFGAWPSGKVYSSPLWIGARFGNTVDRIGYSHPMVQDRTQNWVHRNGFFYLPFGHQNFYVDYSQFRFGMFLQTGYYNPYSLWGK
ncbi:RHS repeat-associated protein [Dyadobacter sp. BE34]|uniref:RHS repeat-associated protein n=1 Tax=Dyadobacter fermentans TaxID=94254 RepID=A0ABU1R275_9BACT|nr:MULTISPECIES: polymorphic toxin type 23 domain-containing protein [Dyadobacter]MDR7199561.1 RHS repeat-associated protein [Dyadobacter sp. BE34]MDR6807507.1 RHS repeat-associated protein [Dyadobacter fermentans]MDR7045248.1 RHS repeat-associated protein [Dyadobacter sp. BE242]MDR7217980.1 RHS repeat-associated protein [Dyadobacter sp. BE31]MDR7265452.1 RHS repeat-associated protein [Dyadobacter sp. BE32]